MARRLRDGLYRLGSLDRSRRGLKAVMGLMLTLGALLAPLEGCNGKLTDSSVDRVAAAEVARLLGGKKVGELLVLDARTRGAYLAGHIPGAVNFSLSDLNRPRKVRRLERFERLVVYGQDPGSGAAVAMAKRLISMGHKDVQLFADGFDGWVRGGFRVQRGERSAKH